MHYVDSTGTLDTARKILKVNHVGEVGAINIYRAQILISRWIRKDQVPLLTGFMRDEQRHRDIFWAEIQRRNGVRCTSYWLCGIGGYILGLTTGLLGKRATMTCTWAVESVVVEHLYEQLRYLSNQQDQAAWDAVKAILDDEQHHRDTGLYHSGSGPMYQFLRWGISLFTEGVIRFGMR